jgi:hypothetical protein
MPLDFGAGKSLTETQDGAKTQHSLNDFFLRPVSIYDSTWNSNTFYNVSLNVWDLWSRNAAVRAKLSNYAYFKGDLKVKISVSGTPFHYGKLMASYQPYAIYNDNLVAYDALLSSLSPGTTDSSAECYHNYLSQSEGVGTLDIKNNQPIILNIPFISHKQMFRLYNGASTVITNAVSFDDFDEAGQMRLTTLNKFLIANDDYDTHVSVNVYAWVENIELGSITGTNVDITAESKDVSEYSSKGPISTAATTVGRVADLFTKVPYLGAYAKATSTLANGIGTVATWFGFSRPVVLEKTMYVKNQPFSNGANLSASDTALRITCDPKQELTVDQSIGGVGGPDEMAIQTLASRETYLTTFDWTAGDTPGTVILWRSLVAPTQYSFTPMTNLSTHLFQPTTTDFVSRPFTHWRGTMKYRLEIVCSKFHRGKLLIRYEPNCSQCTLIASGGLTLNQQNTIIVDIQDTQDLTFEVDWAFPRAWCEVDPRLSDLIPYSSVAQGSLSTSSTALRAPYANGYIEIIPLNELVQPTALSYVHVNVYVSCDDLQLAYPTGRGILGGDEDTHRRYNYTESKDVTMDTINPNEASAEGIHDYHFGERVVSLRSLLKRFQTYTTYGGSTSTNGAVMWAVKGNSIPWLASAVARGTAASEPTNPGEFRNNLYNYMRPAYMGMRGGWRYRVVTLTSGIMTPSTYTRVTMSELADAGISAYSLGTMAATINGALTSGRARNEGTVTFHPSSNGGIEFEIPFYTSSLFLFAFQATYGTDVAADTELGYNDYTNANWTARVVIDHGTTSSHANKGNSSFMVDAIPAEDFTFLRFQGTPFICVT